MGVESGELAFAFAHVNKKVRVLCAPLSTVRLPVRVCAHVCARACALCARACVCMCMCMCVCMCVCMAAAHNVCAVCGFDDGG